VRSSLAAALCAAAIAATAPAGAVAAGAPILGEELWSASVQSTTAHLHGEVNPNGLATGFRFEYIAAAAYQANVKAGKEAFAGALRSPPGSNGSIGAGAAPVPVVQFLAKLAPGTAYRYRLVAANSAGTVTSDSFEFVTHPPNEGPLLADSRGWEMVSPVEKNGGQVEAPGAIAAGGVLQAAAAGGAATYGSLASFAGGQGSPTGSQYVSSRTAAGWSTANVTAPGFSGTYDLEEGGAPYLLFSPDLARGLLSGGEHCRGGESGCPVANPPLPGTDAPAGYRNYYLRENGAFEALLGAADIAALRPGPAEFELAFAGSSPDLRHVVLSTCAALTPDATEVPAGPGCAPAEANLYRWSQDAGLTLLNLPPGETQGDPGAALAAQSGAVSSDGSRVYWTDLVSGDLYLREGGQARQVDGDAGGGGTFETATTDGGLAFYTKEGHLWRYDAASNESVDLVPTGGVLGVLGASADGSHVYYLTGAGLFARHGGEAVEIAPTADASNYPPATGTARVGGGGEQLLFLATVSLTGYDNVDLESGQPDRQVYLYDAGADEPLTCLSCNPTKQRPSGPSWISGSIPNGAAPGAPDSYKPRVLVADGRRVFFESRDGLVLSDSNGEPDVYQWEAGGEGSCARPRGCLSLISSGRAAAGASFVDASADGADAFFLTAESLVRPDPGAIDLYDARIGGGFPERPTPLPCEGDNCRILPAAPVDPTLTTLQSGPGNPPVRYQQRRKRCKGKRAGRAKAKQSRCRRASRAPARRRGR
jgi:hypothetical protein